MSERYERQVSLDLIGKEGQLKLSKSRILVIGCGGLGGPVAVYLASAGVGEITLLDGDNVEKSNLPRQVFFKSNDSENKAELIKEYIGEINPSIVVNAIPAFLIKENIELLNNNYDVVVDGTDDWITKFLIADYCHIHKIPLSFAALYKSEGCLTFFNNETPNAITLRDVYSDPSAQVPNCAEIGVMNTIVGIISSFQANDVLKFLLGSDGYLLGKMLWYNGVSNQQNIIKLRKTHTTDMQVVFDHEDYLSIHCRTPLEISLNDLTNNKNLKLVSILEEDEFVPIHSMDIIKRPMSKFSAESYNFSGVEDDYVFYCYSGVRSLVLVKELKERYPDKNILSLSGGIKNLKVNS
jgi:adenylyltransferase/sulfurtransferase